MAKVIFTLLFLAGCTTPSVIGGESYSALCEGIYERMPDFEELSDDQIDPYIDVISYIWDRCED